MKFSVLLPTIGRPTLLRTLLSLKHQAWELGDEILLLSDDNHGAVADILGLAAMPRDLVKHFQVEDGPYKDWGHTPRNLYMRDAAGDFLCHFDDDDVAARDMIHSMRQVCVDRDYVHMFRMVNYGTGRVVWTKKGLLKRKHISTQNIVHPFDPDNFGKWGTYYGGDSAFIRETAGKYPGRVQWHEKITCVYNPPAALSYSEVQNWLTRRP